MALSQTTSQPFRVLSIDGGGMRGIYTATYLSALEKSFSKIRDSHHGLDIGKAFNLIVGTSTGAIVGCALAQGTPSSRIVDMYRAHGKEIFPRKLPANIGPDLLKQLFRRPSYLKSGDSALRKALSTIFGDITVEQLWKQRGIALAVPAVNIATYRSWVFKTPHDPNTNHRDDNYSIVDVCMASSAAPIFRSLAAVNRPGGHGCDIFADGGLWANNPVMVALLEALRMSGEDDKEIEIFAVGTCGKPEGEVIAKEKIHRGFLEWKFGGEAAKLSIAAQEFAFDMMAKFLQPHLRKRVTVIRFPSDKIPAAILDYLDLDETRPEAIDALIGHAHQDANMTNSAIQQKTADGLAIQALFQSMPFRESEPRYLLDDKEG